MMTREYQDNRLSMSEFSMSSWKLLGPAKFSIRDKKIYIYVSANPQKTRDSFPVCQNVTSNGREGGIESALASFRGESG